MVVRSSAVLACYISHIDQVLEQAVGEAVACDAFFLVACDAFYLDVHLACAGSCKVRVSVHGVRLFVFGRL